MASDQMLRAHALLLARTARAHIRVTAMICANGERERCGEAQAYSEEMIYAVIDEESLGENAVLNLINGGSW
jgi:hypothetical protein